MNSFNFWKNWLIVINLITIVIGLLIAFAGDSLLFQIHNEGTFQNFFEGRQPSQDILDFKKWLFGIIGATIVGFHVLIVFIAIYPYSRREQWTRNAIALAMTSWFLLDSFLSFSLGADYNVYFVNIPSYCLIMLPVVMTWRSFSVSNA